MGQVPSTAKGTEYALKTPIGVFTGNAYHDEDTKDVVNYNFTQIPYCVSTTGANRWSKPKPLPVDHDYTGTYREIGLQCPHPPLKNPKLEVIFPKEAPSDEDITYLNISVPGDDSERPAGGWPVLVYIHGGWLQYGSPNLIPAQVDIQGSDFKNKFIFVSIGYRINVFGFLTSKKLATTSDSTVANFGLWDQRAGIEWTYKNIAHFGGNPEKITVSGLSAGSYSTFFQLAYEIYHPEETQIIKQVVHFSNCLAVQPKTVEEVESQFDTFCEKLGIEKGLNDEEIIEKLVDTPAVDIVTTIRSMEKHTFRACTDGDFISTALLSDMVSGVYAKKLTQKNVRIFMGEVNNEPALYGLFDDPQSEEELATELENYYPVKVVPTLLNLYPKVNKDSKTYNEDLLAACGRISADCQVYCSSRGFLNQLAKNGFPIENIFRYRVAFRLKCIDEKMIDNIQGVTHGLDLLTWFYQGPFTETESTVVKKFLGPYMKYLSFASSDEISWGTKEINQYKLLSEQGEEHIVQDTDWEWGLQVTDAIYKAQLE